MDIQTQVIKFFSGKTTTKKDKWDVYFADGSKATAWEYAVAAKAEQAWKSGETVTAQIEEKPNGNGGVYRNLKGITLSGVTGSPVAPQAGSNLPLGTVGPQKPLGGFSGGMSPEDKIRVTKLSCISSAAAIFSGSGDVDQTLEAAKTIFSSVWDIAPAEPQTFIDLEEAGTPVVQVAEKPALPWAVA